MTQTTNLNAVQKVALITGGSGGLGRNAALKLAATGVDIILTYRSNPESAKATADEINASGRKAVALPLDVADIASFEHFKSEIESCLKQYWQKSTLDILINNAGFGDHCLLTDVSEDHFDALINVHFKGAMFLTQSLLPVLSDEGRIINISSGLTRFSMPGYGIYAAVKGAMEVATRYLAKELGHRGITANIIAPGAIDNEFNAAAFEHNPQIKVMIASQTALGRVGESEDIGGVVSMLCRSDARWITGQRIEVSGGMFL